MIVTARNRRLKAGWKSAPDQDHREKAKGVSSDGNQKEIGVAAIGKTRPVDDSSRQKEEWNHLCGGRREPETDAGSSFSRGKRAHPESWIALKERGRERRGDCGATRGGRGGPS